jgi:DNA-binding transcriptional ArsR family regulator
MSDPSYTGMQLDDRAVRVLAHPLRSRLLSQLRLAGPATATELAAALSTNTGATSYHLRALESVGLVVDTGEGVGKRRLWRASTQYHSWTNSGFRDDDDDTRTALEWLQRNYVRQFAERAEHWLDAADAWPAAWVDLLGISDAVVTVTPEQLRDFGSELDALVARYRTVGEGQPAARRVHLGYVATPVELDPPTEA